MIEETDSYKEWVKGDVQLRYYKINNLCGMYGPASSISNILSSPEFSAHFYKDEPLDHNICGIRARRLCNYYDNPFLFSAPIDYYIYGIPLVIIGFPYDRSKHIFSKKMNLWWHDIIKVEACNRILEDKYIHKYYIKNNYFLGYELPDPSLKIPIFYSEEYLKKL